ncbi:HlyIII-domain-containing protein [Rhizodiscina lignyota]|uniref:HlyIII-domain-containing protein n=1 Tax=Rhizodiscina lignyota TaxID=1504668 RepID=A0A9P4MCV7_9PEZI|nr:HlyIII-domain-containing protein [Rhizodiscina lignyota]
MPNSSLDEKRLEVLNETASRRSRLLLITELPEWYQRNDYMLTGYRPPTYSLSTCVTSLTYIHNETANIFSHLLPAIWTVGAQLLLWKAFWSNFPNADFREYGIFALNLFAATVCFSLSAGYHTVINHSERILDLSTRIDYVGILLMIVGNFISGIYVAFYCQPALQKTYWTMIVILSALTASMVLHPAYQHRRYRLIRLAAFVATGLSGFVPVIHAIRIHDPERLWKSGLAHYYSEGALFIFGAFLYGTHLPERLYPGTFDTWFHSHFLFHCFVVAAVAVHYRGAWIAFDWIYHTGQC